jgi:quercetin dioxygenase-like cupin family protein
MYQTEQIPAFAFREGEGENLWFLDFLATVKASSAATDGAVSVIEHVGRRGAASPLHVHRHDHEWWYVIEGELTLWVGGEIIEAPAGSFVFGPRHVAHTFAVTSDEARFLHVTEPGGFDVFMRALAEPADSAILPPEGIAPPDRHRLAELAAEHGIEVLGPPGIPPVEPERATTRPGVHG